MNYQFSVFESVADWSRASVTLVTFKKIISILGDIVFGHKGVTQLVLGLGGRIEHSSAAAKLNKHCL